MSKIHKLLVLCAALALMFSFTTVVNAGELPKETTTPIIESTSESTPFTPPGTGTVIDNATDGNGKEFFTIMTPDENVFYLIIDRQRETENVYFLNAVTERELLPLAKEPDDTEEGEIILPTPEPEHLPGITPKPEVSAEPIAEPEKKNNVGMLFMVLAVVLIGGGAGYYFKIYRPKHQKLDSEDDFDYDDENGLYDTESIEQSDDLPPWSDEDNEDEV